MDNPCSTADQASWDETPGPVALAFSEKVREQIELTQRLVALVPDDKPEWRPLANSFRVGDLLGHLLETAAGLCAALYAIHPEELSHFIGLRDLPVNHCCGAEEAGRRLAQYRTHLEEGLALITDKDLAKRLPTVFTQNGETAMTILLGNLEHLINHKHQLFFYLKLLGLPVASRDLYQFRGD